MAKFSGLQAITANLLCSGAVVYLTDAQTWSPQFADAELFRTKDAVDTALAVAAEDVEKRIVLDPYAFDCREDGTSVHPASVRETVRAGGPTVATQLNTRAVGSAA